MNKTFLLLLGCLLIGTCLYAKRYIATRDITIRSGRSILYKDLGTIKKGTVVNVDDTTGKWREIEYEGKAGYISAKFLEDVPKETLSKQWKSIKNKVINFANKHTIPVLVAAFVLFIVLRKAVKMVSLRIGKRAPYKKQQKPLINYWYQCKHCAALIKKDSEPNNVGCSNSPHHHWTQLAEVGQHKYLCKNCRTAINTKLDPSDLGCPNATLHRWVKKR